MTVIGTITQQPADKIDYDIDCSDIAGADDSIVLAEVAVTPSGLTVTALPRGDKVKLWVYGGVSGSTYKVEVTVTTTLGRIKQGELKVKIKDI